MAYVWPIKGRHQLLTIKAGAVATVSAVNEMSPHIKRKHVESCSSAVCPVFRYRQLRNWELGIFFPRKNRPYFVANVWAPALRCTNSAKCRYKCVQIGRQPRRQPNSGYLIIKMTVTRVLHSGHTAECLVAPSCNLRYLNFHIWNIRIGQI